MAHRDAPSFKKSSFRSTSNNALSGHVAVAAAAAAIAATASVNAATASAAASATAVVAR